SRSRALSPVPPRRSQRARVSCVARSRCSAARAPRTRPPGARVVSVLLAGGGTAGHVNPLLALAAELRRRDAATSLHVLGTREGLEAELVPRAGLEMTFVPRVPVPRRPTLDLLRVPGRLRAAVRAADEALERSGADVVVGFGGYVAAPAYLAARRRGMPVVV